MTTSAFDLARELIGLPSLTPEDAGCQEVIGSRLSSCGFHVESMPSEDVKNLWCRRGEAAPLLVFAGHTDVVPTGELSQWDTPPFEPTVIDEYLHGRGAADMKSSLAAMVVASERFVEKYPNHRGSIGFLITSDEEGAAMYGTKHVVEQLALRDLKIDWCLIGEPSCQDQLGDTVRVGRRGSLNGKLTLRGAIGHVAYPEQTPNVVHHILPSLAKLTARNWDDGNEFFRSTTFQISNINAGTGAENVIPGTITVYFNFRFNTEHTPDELINEVESSISLDNEDLYCQFDWRLSGLPFLSEQGKFTEVVIESIQEITGIMPIRSTGGGTSDGRFIVPTGVETIEFGPVNATIHKYNEHVLISDLDTLSTIYERALINLLT